MDIERNKRIFFYFVLIFAMIVIVQPVLAANSTVSIAYQGSGGAYIGDTIIFDGQDTVGNITVIKITGPDLPPEGVPVYDLNGLPGSGNMIEVNADGSWRFAWYSAEVNGIEKMQTARYHFIVSDLSNPEDTATTSIMMAKPDFNVTVAPNPALFDDYVMVTGNTEMRLDSVEIDVANQSGTIVHSNLAPVSSSGYFNFGFHVDMPPGQYYITVSNPTMVGGSQRFVLTVASPSVPVTTTPPSGPAGTSGTVLPQEGGAISINSTPSGASVYLDSVMMGNTPITLENVSEGSHLVEIKNQGYSLYSIMVTAKDGTTVTLAPVLVKSSSSLSLSPLIVIAGIVISAFVILGRRTAQKKE